MHTTTHLLVDNVEACIFPVPIIGIKFNVWLLLFFLRSLSHLAHRQSSKAYCLMTSLKLEVLHANQTLHWRWEFFIDFLYSIFLFSIWALFTYNCIFTAIEGVTSPPLEMWSWGTRRTRWEIYTNFQSLVWVAWVFIVLTVMQKVLSINHATHYLHYSTQRRTDGFTCKLLMLFEIIWT